MTEEQIEWLKDNLSISVEGNNEADYKDVIVTLFIAGSEISKDCVTVRNDLFTGILNNQLIPNCHNSLYAQR